MRGQVITNIVRSQPQAPIGTTPFCSTFTILLPCATLLFYPPFAPFLPFLTTVVKTNMPSLHCFYSTFTPPPIFILSSVSPGFTLFLVLYALQFPLFTPRVKGPIFLLVNAGQKQTTSEHYVCLRQGQAKHIT